MKDVEHYLSVQNELGETPIWVPEEKSLYWVDFIQNIIFRIDVKTKMQESFKPDMPVRGLCRRALGDVAAGHRCRPGILGFRIQQV